MAIYSHRFNSVNLVGGEPVDTTFSYNSARPYELNMTFHSCDNEIAKWNVSIDTLLEAANTGKSGEGDVSFIRGPAYWTVHLSNGEDFVMLMYKPQRVYAFIVDVRSGRHEDIANWVPFTDADLAELMG